MQSNDFETARRKMLQQQIRPWDVRDERLLGVMGRVPREEYVPDRYRKLAYADLAIPLGQGQVMLPPKLAARLIQALGLGPKDKVLEIGPGCGYVTAVLTGLAGHVYSVELMPALAERTRVKLAQHGVHNVTIEHGDGARGWSKHAPYDAIFVTGSLPLLPDTLKQQLAVGGRLVAIVGRSPVMEAQRITRLDATNWTLESLLETDVPALINAPDASRFVF
jgi:protein-L-isoaspartate(D-aspartate) O-methyltransferase